MTKPLYAVAFNNALLASDKSFYHGVLFCRGCSTILYKTRRGAENRIKKLKKPWSDEYYVKEIPQSED